MTDSKRSQRKRGMKKRHRVIPLQEIEVEEKCPRIEGESEEEVVETAVVEETPSDTPTPVTEHDAEEATPKADDAVVTEYSFDSLELSDKTMDAITEIGYSKMTEVQARTIPHLLNGRDIVGAAKTGSGKTMAFLIPIVELLHRAEFRSRNGCGAIIITPTRELALQIYGELTKLLKYHNHTFGLAIGGSDRAKEVRKLQVGTNILVATPGRLLDHLQNTPKFTVHNLKALVVDEADRILEIGFEQELRQIVDLLPKDRQSMLFSATQTQKLKEIARISTREGKPMYIGVDDQQQHATRTALEQGYVICKAEDRFRLLYTFLKKKRRKEKIIVFFSTCCSVQYHAELFNYVDIPVLSLHGKMKQGKRTSTFFEFANATSGVLLCTDIAARGLDIPKVDWILQYDPASDPKEYIHRVGRTARGVEGATGKALTFLLPQQLQYLRYLKESRVPVKEYQFPPAKLTNIQSQLEKLLETNYYLHKSAREAYRSYIQGYAQASLKDVFDVHSLDLVTIAKSFGFEHPPRVQLKVALGGKNARKRHDRHGFSQDNPYGKQWSR